MISGHILRSANKMAWLSVAVMLLTTVHHLYGAAVYSTPWRHHVAVISIPVIISILVLLFLFRRYAGTVVGKITFITFIGVVLALPVAWIGMFEGGYGHTLKNALYFGGASRSLLDSLYPAPLYKMPDNTFFEATGIMQFFVALLVIVYAYLLIKPSGEFATQA